MLLPFYMHGTRSGARGWSIRSNATRHAHRLAHEKTKPKVCVHAKNNLSIQIHRGHHRMHNSVWGRICNNSQPCGVFNLQSTNTVSLVIIKRRAFAFRMQQQQHAQKHSALKCERRLIHFKCQLLILLRADTLRTMCDTSQSAIR